LVQVNPSLKIDARNGPYFAIIALVIAAANVFDWW